MERHLLCIEDPFERSHDLGRTVHRDGVYQLRKEFGRAARICYGQQVVLSHLFEPAVVEENSPGGNSAPIGRGGAGSRPTLGRPLGGGNYVQGSKSGAGNGDIAEMSSRWEPNSSVRGPMRGGRQRPWASSANATGKKGSSMPVDTAE
eukprot:jgi/Chrzof1/9481/Cz04g04200.t1